LGAASRGFIRVMVSVTETGEFIRARMREADSREAGTEEREEGKEK